MEDGDDVRRHNQGAVRLLRECIDGALDIGGAVHGGEGQFHAKCGRACLDRLHVLSL